MVDGIRMLTTMVGLGVMVLVAMLAVVAGCGSGDEAEAPSDATLTPAEAPFAVSEVVVSHETTQDISVWMPEAEGSWPVVFMIHGWEGLRQDLAETATELASQGSVVFVPDYDSTDPGGPGSQKEQDIECGYRYAYSIADEYGGDLDQPVTFVGYSHGASMALGGGVSEQYADDSYGVCFTGTPLPDVIVAIAGCYYEVEGQEVWPVADVIAENSGKVRTDTDLVLVAGADDPYCQPWQSEDATETLKSVGYNVKLVVLPGGNHSNVIFKAHVEGEPEWVNVPDDPVGQLVVETILEAIDAAEA